MHAIEHPHLPRVGWMATGALVLAVIVLLLAASRVGGLGASHMSEASRATIGPQITVDGSGYARAFRSSSPFASPFHIAIPWTKPSRR